MPDIKPASDERVAAFKAMVAKDGRPSWYRDIVPSLIARIEAQSRQAARDGAVVEAAIRRTRCIYSLDNPDDVEEECAYCDDRPLCAALAKREETGGGDK